MPKNHPFSATPPPPPKNSKNVTFYKNPLVLAALEESHLFVCTRFCQKACCRPAKYRDRHPIFGARKVVFCCFWNLIFCTPPCFSPKCPFLGGSEHFLPNLGPPPVFASLLFWGGVAKSTEFFAGKGPPFAHFFRAACVRVPPPPDRAFSINGGLEICPADPKMADFCQVPDFGPLVLAGSWARSYFFKTAGQSHF